MNFCFLLRSSALSRGASLRLRVTADSSSGSGMPCLFQRRPTPILIVFVGDLVSVWNEDVCVVEPVADPSVGRLKPWNFFRLAAALADAQAQLGPSETQGPARVSPNVRVRVQLEVLDCQPDHRASDIERCTLDASAVLRSRLSNQYPITRH